MADKNIDINIKTTADTAGAKETEEAIKGVSSEVEDLNEANRKNAEEQRGAEQAADVSRLKSLAYAKALQEIGHAAEQAAAAAHAYAKEIGETNKGAGEEVENVAKGFDYVAASANGAAAGMAALGPPGAVIGAVVGPALAKLKEEALGAFESFAKLKEIEQIGKDLPAAFERVKKASMMKAQVDSWKELLEQMKETEREAASLAKIAQAQRDLEEFTAKQQLAIAKAGGGDVGKAEKNLRSVQVQNFNANQEDKLRPAEDALVKAQIELAMSQGLAARRIQLTDKDQIEMAENLAKYKEALATAERNLKETQALSDIERQKFGTGNQTTDKVSELQKKKTDETSAIGGINTLVDAIGTGGSKELQDAAAALSKMVDDNNLSADDLQNATTKLSQFGNQITNLGQAQNAALLDANSRIDQLIRDVANLRAAAKNPTN